jgi:cytosine/adenosine deaminase-related metal-dependent hydrolase
VGIRPSLSGDAETLGCADMFTQMRLAVGYYRSWTGGGHSVAADAPATLSSRDVLEFATLAGARANGLDRKIGSITPGKDADLIMVRHRDLNLTPVTDPVAAVVHGAHAGNVDTVMVAGRVLKRHGRLVNVDLDQLVKRAQQSQAFLDSAA